MPFLVRKMKMTKTSPGILFIVLMHNNYYSTMIILFSDDMKQLVYLKYCIKESLRLFPPVSGLGRVLDQDTNITGHVMPKGTSVTLSIYAVHRHPDFWENPDVMIN
jgi:cytochrome P450